MGIPPLPRIFLVTKILLYRYCTQVVTRAFLFSIFRIFPEDHHPSCPAYIYPGNVGRGGGRYCLGDCNDNVADVYLISQGICLDGIPHYASRMASVG